MIRSLMAGNRLLRLAAAKGGQLIMENQVNLRLEVITISIALMNLAGH
jgi:hypothetical protein